MMLEGKIAIVTGGASGIGAATARLLSAHGAQVIIASEQSEAAMRGVVDGIVAAGGSARAHQCDIRDRAQIRDLIETTERDFGRIDILVQSAGVCAWGPIEDMLGETIDLMFGVNVIGAISMIQAVLPAMRRAGGGAIVNIGSASSTLGVHQFAAYAASKAAIEHFTRTLAPELRRSNIRINGIAPGSVRTPMLGFKDDTLTAEQRAAMARREERSVSPYGNALIEPNEIASVALFLVSDAARALQGSFVLADQGVSSAMMPPAG